MGRSCAPLSRAQSTAIPHTDKHRLTPHLTASERQANPCQKVIELQCRSRQPAPRGPAGSLASISPNVDAFRGAREVRVVPLPKHRSNDGRSRRRVDENAVAGKCRAIPKDPAEVQAASRSRGRDVERATYGLGAAGDIHGDENLIADDEPPRLGQVPHVHSDR